MYVFRKVPLSVWHKANVWKTNICHWRPGTRHTVFSHKKLYINFKNSFCFNDSADVRCVQSTSSTLSSAWKLYWIRSCPLTVLLTTNFSQNFIKLPGIFYEFTLFLVVTGSNPFRSASYSSSPAPPSPQQKHGVSCRLTGGIFAISVLNYTCVKFSLCVIKQFAMKAYEEIHEFLTSALDRRWSAACPGRFTFQCPFDRELVGHQILVWIPPLLAVEATFIVHAAYTGYSVSYPGWISILRHMTKKQNQALAQLAFSSMG
jgi:hypothetical protein